jgi:hypothetical protein
MMYGTYMILIFVLILFAVGGVEATMRFFAYVDLQLRYAWVQFRMELMRRKLKRQLDKDNAEITKLIKELTNDR